MNFRKGTRVLKEYNWLKRSAGLIFSVGLLLIVSLYHPFDLWPWIVLLLHSFSVVLWYGSKVKIDSIYIGFRYSVFFFLFSLALLFRHETWSIHHLLLSLSYVIMIVFTAWSLPRVKLGLQVVKPVGSIYYSLGLILIGYNLLMYIFVSKNWQANLLMSFAIVSGFIFLYSTYSRKNTFHFIGLTYIVHQFLFEYLLYNTYSTIEYIIVVIIYIIFTVIQMNTKVKKKGE